VTVGVSSADPTEGIAAPSSLTFTTANWAVDQTVTVIGMDDNVADGDQNYFIELSAMSNDNIYNGLDPSYVAVKNLEDADTVGLTVSGISGNTTEPGGTATFTVRLTVQPVVDVTVAVSSLDTSEGTATPSSLTFTALDWDTKQVVTVTGVDDSESDGDQYYAIQLSLATSNGPDLSYVLVTNIDNETVIYEMNCTDDGLPCIERATTSIPGNDSDNLNSTVPRVDIEFEFMVDVLENSGTQPEYIRLYMAQRNNPTASEFYAYDMECAGGFVAGATCTYKTELGPAEVHTYYFEMKSADGTITKYPSSGYMTGPTVHLLTGYNLVSIPRDTSASNLGGNTAFGTANSYRWDGALGYYTQVTGSSPVEPAEGYFVNKASTSLPQHDSLGEVQVPEYEYQLQPGWNIISNPYGCNVLLGDIEVKQNGVTQVDWDSAVASGWLSNAIYYYEGSDWGGVYDFETAPGATLVPWLGYWVHVNDDTNTYTLVIKKP
jgi:hypothetical protein